MKDNKLKIKFIDSYLFYEFLLLLASLIWGFAFVAQRVGMDYIGPFLYNGIRFFLGSLSLLPFLLIFHKKDKNKLIKNKHFFNNSEIKIDKRSKNISLFNIQNLSPGIIAGIILFIASSLQQIGIVYTTAGKAGFITGLYVVLVPLYGIFLKQKTSVFSWIGVFFSICGLYFLSIKQNFKINPGDFFVFLSAFVWAAHVQYISHHTKKINTYLFSFIQFTVTSLLSLIVAFFTEKIQIRQILNASFAIIYGGIFSVGIAYTLQIFGQKKTHPSHAAIILSSESLFAALGGFLILHEILSIREFIGCFLMFSAIIISQIKK